MKLIKITGIVLLVIILTIISQVGGLILILCIPIWKVIRKSSVNRWKQRIINFVIFTFSYVLITLTVIPLLAPITGRVALPVFNDSRIKPLNYMTCLLNRHYVTPELKNTLEEVAKNMEEKYPETVVAYLDANFPFFNNFPLIPHLSHDDGEKLDLAFFYKEKDSLSPLNRQTPSFIGYGAFEGPKPGETDSPAACHNKGYWQYSLIGKLIPGKTADKMVFDEQRTKYLTQLFSRQTSIGKIFIEPHLKERWQLNSPKIRYHGCHAVRHDDHIHVQL